MLPVGPPEDIMRFAMLVLLAAVAALACPTASTEQGIPATCDPTACGPSLGMPNWLCPDGSVAGPTGRCLQSADGGCGWEVLDCAGGGAS
jgi:hypothetical protein